MLLVQHTTHACAGCDCVFLHRCHHLLREHHHHFAPPTRHTLACHRFIYPRHNTCDENVVPYHCAVLAAWGAHMNIQRVTATAWSFYVSSDMSAHHHLLHLSA